MKLFYKIITPFFICLLSVFFITCNNGDSNDTDVNYGNEIKRDLPQIKKNDTLNVITLYNSTSYFLYRGHAMGYEYEMAKDLAKNLGLKMNIVVAKNFSEVFELLNSGKGDIIAFGLTITKKRKEHVTFTDYLYFTHQVLVQRKPKNWRRLPKYKTENQLIRAPYELIGDTISVGKGTSYLPRLKNLENEVGGDIYIKEIGGDTTTDDIINMVVSGEINYTVADNNLALVNKHLYPILDVGTNLSLSQRIAWAVRKNSPKLLKAVNEWIKESKKKPLFNVLYHKYFKNKRGYRIRMESNLFSKISGRISPYDDIIKKYAKENLGWDWRLLCAQIYQESGFNPMSEGALGAGGLLQIMPETAQSLGIKNLFNPVDNLRGGTKYLRRIYDRLDVIPDSIQRIKFTLAAYNSGLGHVFDAQRLAKAFGKNPKRWDDNTEDAMLKLRQHKYFTRTEVRHGIARGKITYDYVREIFNRYELYLALVPDNDEKELRSK